MFAKKSTVLIGIFVVVIALSFLTTHPAHAAPIDNFPVTVTQPDGTKLNLFASGDEFYNWLHDAQGYTVIQDPDTGYYVYADLVSGKLVPTGFIAGRANPASVGLRPHLNISPEQMGKIRQAFLDQTKQAAGEIRNAPHTGTINNLVIFIHFSDESEFTDATSRYTDLLNNSTTGADSLRNYYREVSYNALTVNSTLLPTPGTTVVSYQDSHPRWYYQPYDATTNPGGYTGGDLGDDRRVREHTLLRDAINHVSGLGQFPSGASIDGDGDGIVDSLTFIVSGSPTGWSSLLWPHQWSLYTYTVTINGKTVQNYSFHLNSMLDTGVLAHEMFHVLGAPDLYHYSSDGLQPVGGWDVMENTADTPQHMGCYMKFKYGNWISSIPELSTPATYTLNPLTSSTNNCYKIASPYSATEYFVVEYRNGTGSIFESSLPGTGLLVYRINTLETGNAYGPPDEVYIYRPGGTTTVNGSVNTANFSSNVGRTAINDGTNPSSFLSDGSAGGLNICNVGASNATISFDICSGSGFAISGNAGVGGATLSYTDGTPKTATADGSGHYSFTVPSGWSGTVTPSKTGYTFTPPSRPYTNVLANQTAQDYTAAVTPTGLFKPYVTYSVGSAQAVGVGDFNNDGLNDAVVTTSAGELKILLQNDDGSLASPITYAAGSRPESLAVGDLNHDGLDDIVVTNFSSNTISVFLQQADGTMAARTTYATNTGPDAVAVGDINGDGLDDVAVANWNAAYISIFTQNASGTLNAKVDYVSPQAGYDDIAIGDVNGDGLNDVVKMNGQLYANPDLSVYLQTGSGTLASAVSYSLPGNILGRGIGIGDVTGDGKADVVMSYGGNSPTAFVAVFAQAVDGSLQAPVSYSAYDIPEPVEVADVDLDGLADVVVAHGGWEAISVYPQKNNGTLDSYSLYGLPEYNASHYKPQGLVIGDINHDNAPDVLVADYNYGLVVLYHQPIHYRIYLPLVIR